jgi:DNA-binding SARP family transcriptional activator
LIEEHLIKKAVDRHDVLQIFCLGVFRAVRPGEVEAIGIVSKHKMWLLFKYLVVHKGSAVRTEKIMELFWPGSTDPSDTSTLRTTISRLKSLLEPQRMVYGRSSFIIYCKDSCAFNLHTHFWLDTDEFESLCTAAHRLGGSNRSRAMDLYLEALDLYQGDFLVDDPDLEWAVIPREHYRRLFIDSTIEVATWLQEMHEYSKAITLLKRAIKIDPYVEGLQILLMKALLGMGNLKAAAEQYSYYSSFLYKELGVKPSEEWKHLYKQIRENREDSPNKLILEGNLQLEMKDTGPFVCDTDFFWNFLLFERRRLSRNGGESSLVVLELIVDENKKNTGVAQEGALENLESVAFQKLRRCDVMCRMDDNHVALLLPFTGSIGSTVVARQIKDAFCKQMKDSASTLLVKVKRVIPL